MADNKKKKKVNEYNKANISNSKKTKEVKATVVKEPNKIIKKENTKTPDKIMEKDELARLLKIILIVVALFLVFYGITLLLTKNETKNNSDNNEITSTIQYDTILIKDMLNRAPLEYYVLAYSAKDNDAGLYNIYKNIYTNKDKSLDVYLVNIDDVLNKSYIADKSNVSNDLKELKISGPTLFRVRRKTIRDTYEGKDKIVTKFNELIK